MYRDLKLTNLMAETETGRLRLVDLGLAKRLEHVRSDQKLVAPGSCCLKRTYSTVGTMHALAPEMLTLGEEMHDNGLYEIGPP